jgi:hypothetical protein
MERHDSFTGAGGHREQHAPFALDDGLHRAVDCDLLVIMRLLASRQIDGREQFLGGCIIREFLTCSKSRPEFLRLRKSGNAFLNAGDQVEFDDLFAIAGIGEL